MKGDSFSSGRKEIASLWRRAMISEDNKPNFSATNSTSISWASTAYWVLLSGFHIQQIFTEYLLCARSYSSCWGPEVNKTDPKKTKKILCSQLYDLLWDTHNKQRRKCQSAKIYIYICMSAKGCSDCWWWRVWCSLAGGTKRVREIDRPEGGRRVVDAEI